ncbi:MAG: NHL repeat-containing protein [Clostridiales bacterium]|jgi:outer membrane protein assembly factor BamB|nr:NHL repeat-containing protein [Clostridiales bacterium]
MRKKLAAFAFAVFFIFASQVTAFAQAPYDSYNYDHYENLVFTPAAYLPEIGISGMDVGAGAFKNPQDMAVGPDGHVYVADTGNNRIVELSEDMRECLAIYDSFDNNGSSDSFANPTGIDVTSDGVLYVADTDHERIVALDHGTLVKVIEDPESEMLSDDYVFFPLKVCVDYAGRVYAVARGMFQGIMVFDEQGSFTGFFGTINVQISAWQKIWRKLSTQAQRQRQALFIPTEFTGVDAASDGFIFASNKDPEGVQAVRRLNPKGEDVIKRGKLNNLSGDVFYSGGSGAYSGPSVIVDVKSRQGGIYSLLDSRRGRIFTYDHEGNLLYVFGGLGAQEGTFRIPSAIESSGSRMMVLDSYRCEILAFEATEYGLLINEATELRFSGDEAQAVEKWKEVLKLNEAFELANSGIGKAYLTAGDNVLAMKHLKLGMNRHYYSIAFKRYRNDWLSANFQWIMTAVLLLVVAIIAVRVWIAKKKGGQSDDSSVDEVFQG